MVHETKKILHVLPWLSSGGVEQRRAQLVTHLSAGYEHRICTMFISEHWQRFYEEQGVRVDVFGTSWSLRDWEALSTMVKIIEDWRPDVVHGAVFEGMFMAAASGYIAGAKRVVIEETGAGKDRSAKSDLLIAALSAVSSRCVAVSSFAEQFLRERSMITPPKLVKITNGARFPVLPDEDRRADWGFGPDDFVVGSVGRLVEKAKSFKDLLCALTWCPERVKVLLVGDGPDRDMLQDHARQLGLEDRVVFAGYQSDVGPFLKMMDCFVLPSTNESFGLVLVEAMSASLPCIGTRAGEMARILGEQGLIVEIGDPEGIAGHINRLHAHPEEAQTYGQALRARAYERYSSQRYARDVGAFYQELCAAIP